MDNNAAKAIVDTPAYRARPSNCGTQSRLALMRPPQDAQARTDCIDENRLSKAATFAAAQKQNTKRRKGSLRKVVLGREAHREKRDTMQLTINTEHQPRLHRQVSGLGGASIVGATSDSDHSSESSDVTPWPTLDDAPSGGSNEKDLLLTSPATQMPMRCRDSTVLVSSPTLSYKSTSTTDEEDGLHMPQPAPPLQRPGVLSSTSESYFSRRSVCAPRRSSQVTKSPLSYAEVGLSTTSVQTTEADWDCTETEWWGYVVLTVTWFVFVTGMGSCFGVWSWAWDVGTTPYAPPELEDDETLPIVGYYPALLILTGVMAWIWVIVAWIGMKYFRHAKITGD